MSKYTTGEIAKLCNVTVRTVQYYDHRNILVPSDLSEGGRRLYSEEDLHKLKIICFLRNMGLSIHAISDLFTQKDPQRFIALLLEEQERCLQEEIEQRKNQLDQVEILQKELRGVKHFSVASLGDIAYKMGNRRKLRSIYRNVLILGILMDLIEYGTFLIWILTGVWWPFVIGFVFVILLGIRISTYYYQNTAYICPQCHTVFKPRFKDAFFAGHSANARKLTCTCCHHHGYCVETYAEGENLC